MFLLKYIGLLNIIFFGTTGSVLAAKSDGFTLKKYFISDLALDKKRGQRFNQLLFIFALGQGIFSWKVCNYYSMQQNRFSLELFLNGAIFLCFAS